MVEVLVSDLGKVVLPFDFSPSKAFLRHHSRLESHDREPWAVLSEVHNRLLFGAGGCPAPEFFRQVQQALALDCTYDEFCRAYSDVFFEDPAVVDLIRQARVRYRFLLSNTNEIHWNWIQQTHGSVLEPFDRLLVSQELQAEKPHPEIFRKVEAVTGLPPESHLLIDDMQENVEGARACGWDAILHTDASALETELRARRLL